MMKRWWLAFEPGNMEIATKVAKFMRNAWSFRVDVDEGGYIKYVMRQNGRDWRWDDYDEYDLPDLVLTFTEELGMGFERVSMLDLKFEVVGGIGRYTILPLPKDPVKQPPAAASSPSAKEGVSFLPPSISHQ